MPINIKHINGLDLICTGCNKRPSELEEYIFPANEESISPEQYCWEEEGTLNRENGHFLCTSCYIKAGMPSSASGWSAK